MKSKAKYARTTRRTRKHLLNPYWIGGICIVAMMISLALIISATSKKTVLSNSPTAASPAHSPKSLQENLPPADLLNGINSLRSTRALSNLTFDSMLTAAAQARAEDMIAKNYLDANSHNPEAFITSTGYKYYTYKLVYLPILSTDTSSSAISKLSGNTTLSYLLAGDVSGIGFGITKSSNGTGGVLVIYMAKPTSPISKTSVTPSYFNYTPSTNSYNYTPTSYTYTQSCNTSSQRSTYLSQYQSAVSQESSRYYKLSGEISAAIAKLNISNAGGSSAMQQVLAAKAQNEAQHTNTLKSLRQAYDNQLVSLPC